MVCGLYRFDNPQNQWAWNQIVWMITGNCEWINDFATCAHTPSTGFIIHGKMLLIVYVEMGSLTTFGLVLQSGRVEKLKSGWSMTLMMFSVNNIIHFMHKTSSLILWNVSQVYTRSSQMVGHEPSPVCGPLLFSPCSTLRYIEARNGVHLTLRCVSMNLICLTLHDLPPPKKNENSLATQ